MKTPTLVLAVFVSFLAVSQSAAVDTYDGSNYSLVDSIIKAILEKMRSRLSNLQFEDINKEIKNPRLNATIIGKGISVQNADTFVIRELKSVLLPLKLNNLTLTWDNIYAKGSYDVNANVALPEINVPVRVYAKGDARVTLSGIFFTVGANLELKDKVPQIKPRGLFGFDIYVNTVDVKLTSLMGSTELGTAVGSFLSRVIPDAINTLKKPVFDAFHDIIVLVLNQVLKKQGSLLMDEQDVRYGARLA